jgi:Concanavalin A-like lectin/glucanases superfamily/PKD domain
VLVTLALTACTIAAADASAADTIDPIARWTCSAPGLTCDPCPVHCTAPTGHVAAGVAVTFDARVSTDDRGTPGTPNGILVDYAWTFGTDGTGTRAQTTHAFSHAGTFAVTMKVTDAAGNWDTKTLNIVVTGTAPPPPPPAPPPPPPVPPPPPAPPPPPVPPPPPAPPPAPPPPPPPSGAYTAAVTADHPIAYWRLGEASGKVAVDAAGTSNGTYVGGVALGRPGAITGDTNHAVGLNGTNAYVSAPDKTALDTGDAFTLEVWAKRNTTGTSQGLMAKGTGSYQFYIEAGNHVVLRKTGVGEIVRSSVTLTDKTAFHHIVVTKNGPLIHVYIDGVERTGAIVNRALTNTNDAVLIGNGAGYLNGVMDEVAVYNHALTAARVQAHFAAGA